MKILNGIKWTDNESLAATADAKLTGDILSLDFEVREGEKTIVGNCNIDISQYYGKSLEVQCADLEQKNTVVWFRFLSNFNFGNSIPGKFDSSAKKIARIYVGEYGDVDVQWLIYVKPTMSIIERNPEDTHMAAAVKFSSYAADQFAKYKKKSALIGQLDHRDSIAYLEAQVDVLTRYVLSLHKNDEDIAPELREILEAADEFSILDIKSQDKLIGEMKHKEHTRKEQLKYYGQ